MRFPLSLVALTALTALAVSAPPTPDRPPAPPPAPTTEAAAQGRRILETHCRPCHGGPDGPGGIDILDIPELRRRGYIKDNAADSPLFQRLESGEMPPDTVEERPTPEELEVVRAWLDQRAAPAATAARVRSEADTWRALAADEVALSPRARAHTRYLSLAHLAGAGTPEAELARYRTALAVMLASLSWAPTARPPTAVDPQRLLYRIDLRDLGWTAATWDTIRAAYPYGVARPAGVPEALRADWFVAAASRPPLYHAILGLPDRDTDLARLLGVDLAAGIAEGKVARAGFTTSGVSTANRVIERHPTRHGALWRSYDFRSSRGREDVFAHPVDFVAAGGELIFNLPNGLQGYMLVDAAGRRIDKAPTAIVSDPRRPDRAVENGISCIGCHAAGIIPRTDQLRAAARERAPLERDRIEALHPPAEPLARLYAADRARFAAGLSAVGAAPTEPAAEPVTLLVARYEAELDLQQAAAELGLTADDLERRLARSIALRRSLSGLTARGGRLKRETWEALFPRALLEVGAGVPAEAQPIARADIARADAAYPGALDAREPIWIDRGRRIWVRLSGAFDQAGAAAACRARGLELPRAGELATAVADGLAAGLRPELSAGRALWTAGVRLDAANQRYASALDPFTGIARRADIAERHGAVCAQL